MSPSTLVKAVDHGPPLGLNRKGLPRQRRPRQVGRGLDLKATTPAGRREAALVLEVLAGVCGPPQAARELGMALPSYYKLEQRAIQGLINACAPLPPGRQPSVEREVFRLRKDNDRLRRDLQRQQALTRVAQRALGLNADRPSTCTPAAKLSVQGTQSAVGPGDGKRRRRRQPVARALQAVAALRQHADPPPPAPAPESSPPPESPPPAESPAANPPGLKAGAARP